MTKQKKITHRIPFANWINSQFSIARFSGGMKYNGKNYIFDPECKYDKEDIGKPDLITYDK